MRHPPARLPERTGAIGVSVAYRQAPEHRFPTAHEDAFAAYRGVTQNARTLGGDPARIATAGESARGQPRGGRADDGRARGVPLPVHILSVYPIADGDVQSASYERYTDAQPLSRGAMEWFFNHYKPDWRANEHPWIGLVDADLRDLPPPPSSTPGSIPCSRRVRRWRSACGPPGCRSCSGRIRG